MSGAAYYFTREELADNFDPEEVERILAGVGGTKFFLRSKLGAGHPLIERLGEELARKLADFAGVGIGGLLVEFPLSQSALILGHRRRLNELLATPGKKAKEIAQELGINERSVRRARARLRAGLNAKAAPKTLTPGHLSGARTL